MKFPMVSTAASWRVLRRVPSRRVLAVAVTLTACSEPLEPPARPKIVAPAPLRLNGPTANSATVIDLGNLPGATYSSALAVNSSGVAVGNSGYAARFNPPALAPCNSVACAFAALGVNDAGVMVGSASFSQSTPPFNITKGFMWSGSGLLQPLVWLPDTMPREARDINNDLGVVGNGALAPLPGNTGQRWHAVYWSTFGGVGIDLGTLPSNPNFNSIAHAITPNRSGPSAIIVGSANTSGNGWNHAVKWENGVITDLGTLAGATLASSEAFDVSDEGVIVGLSERSTGGTSVAAVWENGAIHDLGVTCGAASGSSGGSVADGVVTLTNGTLLVVGTCGSTPAAWYRRPGGAFGMELLPLLPGTNIGRALDVNASGQIVGSNSVAGSSTPSDRAVLWQFSLPNSPPNVAVGGPYNSSEGAVVSFAATASDPDNDPLTYAWDFGDGSAPGTGSSPSHSYADDGTYTVTVSANDGTAMVQSSTTATVTNVAPTGTLQVPGVDVEEGSPFAIAISGATDPSPVDVAAGLTFAFDCENDGVFTSTGTTPNITCAGVNAGNYLVHGRVTDQDGASTTHSASVTVVVPAVNFPPTLTIGGPFAGAEGATIAFSANGSDPESQPLTYTWDFGDGSPVGSGAMPSHSYADNGSYTVTVTVSDGVNATSASTAATIANVAPSGTITAPVGSSAPQGNVTLTLGNLMEPSPVDAASLQYRFNCGSGFGAVVSTPSITCALPITGSRTLRIAMRDKDGGQVTYTKIVNVTNVGPTVTILSPTTVTISAGTALTFSASFTDPGTGDNPWTARVNWGKGQGVTTVGSVTPGVPFGSSRVYPTAGTYTVLVEVKDKFGAFLKREQIAVVVQ